MPFFRLICTMPRPYYKYNLFYNNSILFDLIIRSFQYYCSKTCNLFRCPHCNTSKTGFKIIHYLLISIEFPGRHTLSLKALPHSSCDTHTPKPYRTDLPALREYPFQLVVRLGLGHGISDEKKTAPAPRRYVRQDWGDHGGGSVRG